MKDILITVISLATGFFMAHALFQLSHKEIPAPEPSRVRENPASQPEAIPTQLAPRDSFRTQVLNHIWLRESSCGQDPKAGRGHVGPAGERGEYQITPIFEQDILRITGLKVDVYDNADCRTKIWTVLQHYASKLGCKTVADYYRLYNVGYGHYKENKL